MDDPDLAARLNTLRPKPPTPEELAKIQADNVASTTAAIAEGNDRRSKAAEARAAALVDIAAKKAAILKRREEEDAELAALEIGVASLGVVDIAMAMGVEKIFAAIRTEVGDDKLDNKVILQAIGEAAGMKDFTVAVAVVVKAAKKAAYHSPASLALQKALLKATAAGKAQKKADDAVAKAKAEGKKTNELGPLVETAKAAKAKAIGLRAEHRKLKDANEAAKAVKKAATEAAKEAKKAEKAAKKK